MRLPIFKTMVRRTFGAQSRTAARILDASQRVRRPWTDPLDDPPPPFFNPDHSVLVVWSAKSASSLTLAWCLSSVGLGEDLIASGLSPHEYRSTRYPNSTICRRSKVEILDDCWIVHVIRDPYLRAVSSYRQALATGYADKRFEVLGDHLFDRQSGFSFSRYLDYLESIDLSRANIHHKLQRHRIEAIKPADRVINISRQDLTTELNRVESERNMPHTDFRAFRGLLTREKERRSKLAHASGDTANLPLNAVAANGLSPWPDYQQFLNPTTRRRIESLYAPDFEAFGAYL